MKKIYFTVGPSHSFPTFHKHIKKALKEDIPSLNHRSDEFKNLFKDTQDKLKQLLNIPKDYQIFFVSSSLESMEITILGCVNKQSFQVITGSFGKIWTSIAQQLGKIISKHESEPGKGVELSKLYIPSSCELICITQNDTSSGVWIPPKDIYEFAKKYPEKLIAVDAVSSIPIADLDFKYIDITFFSVQKAFGLPSGLGVMIVSPKALAKAEALSDRGINIGSYHSLKNLNEKALEYLTPETPNVLNIYLLNKVVRDMLGVGLKKIRSDTDKKAQILYKFFQNHPVYEPNVLEGKFQSPVTLVIDVKGESERLIEKLSKKGFIVGEGYGNFKQDHIRIANFPAHKLKDVNKMLKYLV